MKKMLLWSLALFFAGMTNLALAADFKVGVVDIQEVLQKYGKVQQAEDQLKKQFAPQQEKLASLQKQFADDMTKYNRDSAVMKDADKKAAQDKLMKQQDDLRKQQMDIEKQFVAARDDKMQAILKDVKDAVNNIAQQQKLNLILVKGSVAYNDDSLDITDQVVKALKK
jgi:outer membrane protein